MTEQNKPEDAISEEESSQGPARSSRQVVKPDATGSDAPATAKTAAAGGTGERAEELPYVDDPVSKWWVAIIVVVFVLIFAWAFLFGAGGLIDLGSSSTGPLATPEPTPVTSASPLAAPSVSATPTAELTPKPTPEPTPEPSPIPPG